MKKNYLIFVFVLTLMFGFKISVNADGSAVPGSPDYDEFKTIYDAGPVRSIVSSSGTTISVYGMSTCTKSTNTCTYKYYGLNSENVDTYFENYVTCEDGESSVGYKSSEAVTGASQPFKGTYNGTTSLVDETTNIYWFEEYTLYCLSDSNDNSGDYTVIDNGSTNNTNNNTNNNTSNDTSDDYVTSDPVDNPESGVFTYYVVLGVIAVVSYILLIVAKKYNLFKKI